MPVQRIGNWIIGLLLLALLGTLGGCSSLRLGYSNGQQLTWWWLDRYMGFDSSQKPAAQQAIDRWFAWHRSTQLETYATLLSELQAQASGPLSADAVCQWQDRLQQTLAPAIDQALQEAADLLPLLGEAQFAHLEQRYARGLTEAREKFTQPDRQQRLDASARRTVERLERLYGRLDRAQRDWVRASLETAPLDAEGWLAERARRQAETVRTLRRLAAEGADRQTRLASLQALYAQSERSQDPAYRARQTALAQHNCRFTAELHNRTTPAQRERARQRLKGWEEDLRALVARADLQP